MAGLAFTIPAVAVSCDSTPRCKVGVKAAANQGLYVVSFVINFDDDDPVNEPALVELCMCTFATNSPGTNSTSVTPVNVGNVITRTVQATGGKTWTTEPTVLTAAVPIGIPVCTPHPVMVSYKMLGFDRPIEIEGGKGLALRITSPAVTCNFTGALHCME